MASQTAAPPVRSAEMVGNAFVAIYYKILLNSPEIVYRFYKDSSVLSRQDHNGVVNSVTTVESINNEICSLDYKNCRAEIETADAQESYDGGVVVLVTGTLTGRGNRRRIFTQTFFLAPQENGYFVLNDMFRYVELCEPGQNVATITGVGSPLAPQIQDQGPANLEERQVNNQEEIVVEAESHSNDKHPPSDLETRTAAPEDAPTKKYASTVGLGTGKGPAQVYVPVFTSKAAPVKTGKQEVYSAAQSSAQAPGTSGPTVTSSVSENKVAEDEAESYSIYIRNLPPRFTVYQLEAELKKFGPIKQNGIQVRSNKRQGFCYGFVEFEDSSSMQRAIQASSINIGSRKAVIKIKRSTRQVDSEGDQTSAEQEVARSDRFRGRGNFSGGGWGYGRRNSSGHMNSSWQARNQSGEWRGRGYRQRGQ